MRIVVTLFVFISSLLPSIVAAAPKQTYLVVIHKTAGLSAFTEGQRIEYVPAEIVRVLKRKGSMALVQRSDPIPNANEVKSEKHPAWVPAEDLADASSFAPITAWAGDPKFEVYTMSGDSGQTYNIKPDGTFRAVYDNNTSKQEKWFGRLYKNGRVVWARDGNTTEFSSWTVFILMDSGALCFLDDAQPCL